MRRRDLVLAVIMGMAGASALLGAARAGEERRLPWLPFAGAKAGETARYKLRILDASGREVGASEKAYKIDAIEDGEVRIGKMTLAEGADAPEIVAALRLLPPGAAFEPKTSAAVKAKGPGSKEIAAHRFTGAGTLRDGATKVKYEIDFAESVPVMGLLRADVRIEGGGAGGSLWEFLGE